MLKVPTYDSPAVPLAPLPGPRVTPSAPLEAFGGGRAAAEPFNQVSSLAQEGAAEAQRLHQENRDKADALRLSEERRALNDWEYKNVYDPKTGAMSKTGRNAFGVPDELKDGFDKFIAEREKGLSTDEQRVAFRQMAEARREHITTWAAGHVSRQIAAVEESEYGASLESSKERASVDPTTARLELAIIRDNILNRGHDQGWGEEATAQELQKHITDLHGRVINQMLAGGNSTAATKYYAGSKDSIDPDVRPKIEDALKDADRRSKAYGIIDKVFSDTQVREYTGTGNNWTVKGEAPAKSWEEARDRIKRDAGDDAELRALGEQMGHQRWGDLQHAKEADIEQTYDYVAKLQDAAMGRDPAELDPAAWRKLPSRLQDAIRKRHDPPEKNDDPAWLVFSSLTDAEIRNIPLSEYHAKFWSKLDKHYRDKADTIRRQALEAAQDPAKAKEWKSLMSDEEMMLKGFVGAGLAGGEMGSGGIVRKADTLKAIAEDADASKRWVDFKERIDQRTESYHAKFNKNPDDKELKKIIRDVARESAQKVTLDVAGWFFGLPNRPKNVLELTNDDITDYQFIELQKDPKTLEAFYAAARQAQLASAPAGLSPQEFYDRNTTAVNKAFLLQYREPDLSGDALKLRWKKILKGEE